MAPVSNQAQANGSDRLKRPNGNQRRRARKLQLRSSFQLNPRYRGVQILVQGILQWVVPFFSTVSDLPFSNFKPVSFNWNGIQWPSSEAAYQHAKLLFFGLTGAARTLLASMGFLGSVQIKRMGACPEFQQHKNRRTPLFAQWEIQKYNTMQSIVRSKFRQNEDCADLLCGTAGAILVEASPTDRDWGVGYAVAEILTGVPHGRYGKEGGHSPERWGSNHLGEILMRVRGELQHMRNGLPHGGVSGCPPLARRNHTKKFNRRVRRRTLLGPGSEC